MFYLVDEQHKTVHGEIVTIKDVLYFRHEKAGFDSKAVADHIKSYPIQFEDFQRKNPGFVLPASFGFSGVGFVSAARVVEPEPVVEVEAPAVVEEVEPVVEEVAPAKKKRS